GFPEAPRTREEEEEEDRRRGARPVAFTLGTEMLGLGPSPDSEFQSPDAEVYMHFMRSHCCYDAVPTSCKLVVFDITLEIKKAFVALVANGVRAAPLWDSKTQSRAGLHVLGLRVPCSVWHRGSAHRQPAPLQGSTIPKPRFLQKTVQELCVGTFRDVAVVHESAPIYTALEIFVDRRVSALPVINDAGQVVGLYSRFDVIHLAAQKTYNNLDVSVREALRRRTVCLEGVLICYPHETMEDIINRIAEEQV
ncbi:5'-AMP-activated protein kinase subunit gamma-3, partial [Struthio camelus australis]